MKFFCEQQFCEVVGRGGEIDMVQAPMCSRRCETSNEESTHIKCKFVFGSRFNWGVNFVDNSTIGMAPYGSLLIVLLKGNLHDNTWIDIDVNYSATNGNRSIVLGEEYGTFNNIKPSLIFGWNFNLYF